MRLHCLLAALNHVGYLTRRVWIALEEKGVKYKTVKVDLANRTQVGEPLGNCIGVRYHRTCSTPCYTMLNAVISSVGIY